MTILLQTAVLGVVTAAVVGLFTAGYVASGFMMMLVLALIILVIAE